jgi:hypothetical protein
MNELAYRTETTFPYLLLLFCEVPVPYVLLARIFPLFSFNTEQGLAVLVPTILY